MKTLFNEQFQKEQIQFRASNEPKDLVLHADTDQIQQVLINLVKNAIWALRSEELKEIELFANSDINGQVNIIVSDNGCGIEPDMQDKIFIPFFTSHEGGSGIGLSLSRQIMMMHGGRISVQSKLEEGTSFYLKFMV